MEHWSKNDWQGKV